MNYPERKSALIRATMAHPIRAHISRHGGLLTCTGASEAGARLGGYSYIKMWTLSEDPILLAQEEIDGRFVALFDVSE
jgi:hypothetical protein